MTHDLISVSLSLSLSAGCSTSSDKVGQYHVSIHGIQLIAAACDRQIGRAEPPAKGVSERRAGVCSALVWGTWTCTHTHTLGHMRGRMLAWVHACGLMDMCIHMSMCMKVAICHCRHCQLESPLVVEVSVSHPEVIISFCVCRGELTVDKTLLCML